MKKITSLLLLLFVALGAMAQLKTVSILGDSYSTFEGYVTPDTNELWYFNRPTDRTDVDSVGQTWWHQLISRGDYKLGLNNSYSGSTVCNTGYRAEDYTSRSFITRMDNLGTPDVIFVFGATNDSWCGAPMGEYKYGNWSVRDLYSFRPAMARLLSGLQERHPNAEIYFLLNDGLKESVNESVKTVCARYGVPVIVLEGIDKKSGHPTVKGMTAIADQVEAFLKTNRAK